MKKCKNCKEEKKLEDFRKTKYCTLGICLQCEKIRYRNEYLKNKEKYLRLAKIYREKNKEQVNKKVREWYLKNKEYMASYNKIYREKNIDKIKDKERERYNNNKEKLNLISKKYREKNRDKLIEHGRKYRIKNAEILKEKAKEWYLLRRTDEMRERKNERGRSEKGRLISRLAKFKRTRAKNATKDGSITTQSILELLSKQGYKCAITGDCLKVNGYHVDHIYPLSKGGDHIISNIQLTTPIANMQKSNKIPYLLIN